MTVPDGLAALSQRRAQGRTAGRDGWTTWTLVESDADGRYLATLVIGDYRVHDRAPTTASRWSPRSHAVAAGRRIDAASLARTGEIADFLDGRFGPYPFDALRRHRRSTTTGSGSRWRPSPGRSTAGLLRAPAGDGTWVVAHELAHQWFGDSVSVQRVEDIWLNEGFATYAEWLWAEHEGGQTAQQPFDRLYANANAELWKVPPGDPGRASCSTSRSTSAAR